jgi:predicted transcriptional regulator
MLASWVIAIYALYELFKRNTQKETKTYSYYEDSTINVNKLLKAIYKHAKFGKNKSIENNKIEKISLMEAMNFRPAELNLCISKLLDKGLIAVNDNKVMITKFGVQFFKAFSNDKSDTHK